MQHDCLSLDLINSAAKFLQDKIRYTPIEFSEPLSDLLNTPVYLKLEFFQLTGSFKIRGALFYLSTLSHQQKQRGIAVCSAGNHGLGMAYATQKEKIPCIVYVPKTVDAAKEEKIKKLDAHIQKSRFEGYDETLIWAKSKAKKKDLHFVTAFEDARIMAANGGTIGKEIFQELPEVQTVLFPVGGGGLSAGISYFFSRKKQSVHLIGSQHINSPALALSLRDGKARTALPPIKTVAGGIEGGIGEQCFEILKNRIDDVSLVTENEIYQAVTWLLEKHQYLVEPSAAAPVASCLFKKTTSFKGKVVIVLSGRNIAYSTLKRIIQA